MAAESENRLPNRLIREKSPYLLQHAYNPVDWYPWGNDAFEKARKEDKPIFLSIGYSTCHWCHIMEKESFEDIEVARLMNEALVCIKVDREERPDLDSTFMAVAQILTGNGGWPISVFMTPDKKPFYATSYIPKESRFGLIGMKELIPKIRELWKSQRNKLLDSAEEIIASLKETGEESKVQQEELRTSVLDAAYASLSKAFDEANGGFGGAPKFPMPHNLTFLLRYWKRKGSERALAMVEKTLEAMRRGGIYDQIGFGFHRYSTDARWHIPHFEKMLYDQALLTMAYTEAYQATGKGEYKITVDEILAFVIREMTAPEGGFYSGIDADSEGEEGKFYIWKTEEIRETLSKEDAELAIKTFNINENGNFEEAKRRRSRENVLYLKEPLFATATNPGISSTYLEKHLDEIRRTLFVARKKRVHPGKDDKILVDWNGLMIAALAKAAQAFNEKLYEDAAKKAAQLILTKMIDSNGRLYHRYCGGEVAVLGYLDDYACLSWALLELYETTFNVDYLKYAISLSEEMIKHFWDDERGGFYSIADDAENVLVRRKEIYDGAMPSGNSMAMLNLIRLAHMTGRTDYEDKASRIGRSFAQIVLKSPASHCYLMTALEYAFGPSYEIVIAGERDSQDVGAMLKVIRKVFIPNKVVILRPTDSESPKITHVAEFTQPLSAEDGRATAYICRNHVCEFPTTDVGKILELLKDG